MNADIKPTTTLDEISNLIFDLGESIPEGDYLKLMNYTKDLFNEMSKLKDKAKTPDITTTFKVNYLLKHDERLFRLRRVMKNKTSTGADALVFYQENDTFTYTHYLQVDDYMRVYADDGYKFIKITKINDKSFKYDIILIKHNGEKHIGRKSKVFRFMGKTNYERLTNRNILYYSINKQSGGGIGITKTFYDKLCLDSNGNRVDEDTYVYNEYLKISDL